MKQFKDVWRKIPYCWCSLWGVLLFQPCFSQVSHPAAQNAGDTTALHQADTAIWKNTLSEVTITAFEQQKKLSDQPAPIAYISGTALGRYDDTRPMSALNAVPGVRMEERSPLSYRLNIRGSSLRAPFGVRNVKIYYNGIPMTDPGGNTYLNQLSFDDFGSMEIIKGPASSLYGAGTGGAVLIHSPLFTPGPAKNNAYVSWESGSFGLQKISAGTRWGQDDRASSVRYTHLQSDGYRDHTAMRSDVASFDTKLIHDDKQELDAFFHYTDLFYETPGALTLSQYQENPKAARQASGIFPSSAEAKAAVYQKAFFMGVRHTYQITPDLENNTVVYGSYTDFINPTVRNYEYRKEPHFGGRTVFQYHLRGERIQSRFWFGGEVQQGYFSVKDMQNNLGHPDTLQTDDRINDFVALVFAQADFSLPHGWDFTAGLSMNHERLQFTRLYPAPVKDFIKKYHNVLSPRVTLSKKVTPDILVYANVSKGFSPPAVSEILPSTTVLNTELQAEEGINYEIGSRGDLWKHRLSFDFSAFIFNLTQSISIRRDSSGADYFVNAGGALQKGLELALQYGIYHSSHGFFSDVRSWASGGYLDFRYRDFLSDDKDYSGKKIPGTAPLTLAAGLDVNTRIRLDGHVTWQRTSEIALNDANTAYGTPYNLLGVRFSWYTPLGRKLRLTLSAGGDNLLDETYSLGNDINAVGDRFYNVAPGRNFYAEGRLAFYF
jgi:iron complex outermembrane receptor protein